MYDVRKKKVNYIDGNYYFDIYTNNYPVTIHRYDKKKAMNTFERYVNAGKRCTWRGKWNAKKKKFVDTSLFQENASST